MKHPVLLLLLASAAVAANAQTPAKPAVTVPKPATSAAKPGTATTTGIKLPPGVPPARGIVKSAFSLRYQDIKLGTGADAEPGKMYKVHYTGYRAADGVKFDSSFDHPGQPEKDKDGKPVLGEDGKPKVGPPQPMAFPQGMGRLIPGFDQGFGGMKIGGKRRLFIPWQLAYGMRAIPDHGADHPGIPAKSDLIFDVELVEVTDMPAAPTRPGMGGPPGTRSGAPGGMVPHPVAPGTPGAPPAPGTPAIPSAPATPGASTPPPGTTVTPAPGTVTQPGAPATPPPASGSAPVPSAPATPSTPAPSAPTTPAPATPQPQK
jgi:peptidylprolyl isomerase